MKEYINISIRLRQDSGSIKPSYTKEEIIEKLLDGSAKFTKNESGTIFIVDSKMNDKIMGVFENKPIKRFEFDIEIDDEGGGYLVRHAKENGSYIKYEDVYGKKEKRNTEKV